MAFYKKRVHLELSEREIKYLESKTKDGETLNDTIREYFYIYLQERIKEDGEGYRVVPITNTLNITRG